MHEYTQNTIDMDEQTSPSSTTTREGEQQTRNKFNGFFLVGVLETAFIITGLAMIFFFFQRSTGGDGWLRYQDLLAVLSHHTPQSKYSIIGPLFSLPLLFMGRAAGHQYDWIITYNFVLFTISLPIVYFSLQHVLDHRLLRHFFLLLIVASMFTAHLAFYYGEVFTALFVGFGLLLAGLRFTAPFSWVAIALGIANTPATVVALGLTIVKKIFDEKRFRYLLLLLLAAACILAESYFRRGNIFSNGYTNDHGVKSVVPYSGLPGFSYPFFFGVLSLLFSFGKGLLFYASGLLLPVRKTLLRLQKERHFHIYQVYTLWVCFVIGLILVYARWWAWHGAIFWGPRFLLFASLPASFALATRLRWPKDAPLAINLLTLGLLCLSVWVGINGAVYQWQTAIHLPDACTTHNYNWEMMCYYIPEFSNLWLPFVHHYPITHNQKIFILYSIVIGLYLALPLFITIAQQSRDLFKDVSATYLRPVLWRF